jgi:hypothetical protein
VAYFKSVPRNEHGTSELKSMDANYSTPCLIGHDDMRSDTIILFSLHEEGSDMHLKVPSAQISCPGSVARMLSFSTWHRVILLQY